MLTRKEQEYILCQLEKYNMPVNYYSGRVSEPPQPVEVEIVGEVVDTLGLAEDIWDCL